MTPRSRAIVDTTPVADEHYDLPKAVTLLFSVTCGLAVASVYYAQPLLDTISSSFSIPPAAVGGVIAVTQIGYGTGLLLIVPLGDLMNRRRMIIGQSLLAVMALLAAGLAPSAVMFLVSMILVGMLAVVAQVLVAYAGFLANPNRRGRVVGTVTTGIILGILLARTVSGTLSDLLGWRSVYFVSAAATLLVTGLLWVALPRQADKPEPMSYIALVRSVFALFKTEPVLRTRAMLALFIFSAITVLLTAIVLPLSAPPFSFSHTEIGLFGLAGAAGALGASQAGKFADRGLAQQMTGVGLWAMLLAWLPIAFLEQTIWGLIVGIILIDFGLQAVHVSSQSMIFRVRPEARSRLTAGYMLFYSAGCALGSMAATLGYAYAGWLGVCAIGTGISLTALIFWAITRR